MKSKFTLLIAAFAVLVSFAFISVNKSNQEKQSLSPSISMVDSNQPMGGYTIEDIDQWD